MPVTRTPRVAPLLLLAAILSLTFATRTWQWDDWWHLATGRWMVETGKLPTFDDFSFTARGQPWHGASWGSDIVFYGAYAAFGMAGLALVKVAAAFAVFSLAALSLLELRVSRRDAAGVLIAAWVFVQGRNTTARPEILAAVLLSAAIFAALRGVTRRDRSLYALVPITLVWIPVHSSAVLVLGVIGVTLVALVLARAPRADVTKAAAVLALAALAFGITATGRDILYVASIHNPTVSPLAFKLTYEWKKPELTSASAAVPTALMLAAVIASLVRFVRLVRPVAGTPSAPSTRAEARNARLLPLGLGALGLALWLQAERHVATAVLFQMPLWGLALRDATHALAARTWRGARLAGGALGIALGVGAAGAQLALAPAIPLRFDFGLDENPSMTPGDTLATLRRMAPGRTLNEFHLGGYLIWQRVHPDGVFWDGRNLSLYTERDLRDIFLYARGDLRALEQVADRFHIDYGLATFNGDFGYLMMQSSAWLPVHYGKTSILFVRREAKARATAAGLPALEELRFLPDDAWLAHWYAPVVADAARLAALEREVDASARLAPGCAVLRDLLVFFDDFAPETARRLRARIEAAELSADAATRTAPRAP